MSQIRIAKVKFYNGEKGYGFLKCDGGEEFFFHISDITPEGYIPKAEDKVRFNVTTGKRGLKASFIQQV